MTPRTVTEHIRLHAEEACGLIDPTADVWRYVAIIARRQWVISNRLYEHSPFYRLVRRHVLHRSPGQPWTTKLKDRA